jgi:hypothetical protein
MSYIEWLRAQVGTRKIFLVFGTVVLRDGRRPYPPPAPHRF